MKSLAEIPIHPAANIFPMMGDDELQRLADDIKSHGQRESCVFYQGQLLDGRNRWRACELLGIEPEECVVEREDLEPVAFCLSANLHRRHLRTSQRAMCAARLATRSRGKPDSNSPDLGNYTAEQAAELFAISTSMIEYARTVLRDGCRELIAMCDAGRSVSTVAKFIAAVPDKREQAKRVKATDHSSDGWDSVRYAPELDDEQEQQLAPKQARSKILSAVESIALRCPRDQWPTIISTLDELSDQLEKQANDEETADVGDGPTRDDYYTHESIIAAARQTMGAIDLDPASCDEANQVVGAKCYFTRDDDGLAHEWSGRIWLNPPFSRWRDFTPKIEIEWRSGRVSEMCVLAATRTITAQFFAPVHDLAAAVCVLKGRIPFWGPFATSSPDDGHAIFYCGNQPERFRREFSTLGAVYFTPSSSMEAAA